MKKGILFVVVIVHLISPGGTRGQQEKDPFPANLSTEIPIEFLMNNLVVELHEGTFVSGRLAGIESDALIVRREGKDVRIPSTAIKKVILDKEKKIGRYVLSGMLAGIYVGNILWLRDRYQHQPFAFTQENYASVFGTALMESIFSAAGIGIGWLVGVVAEKDSLTFTFQDNVEARGLEWERMRNTILGIEYRPKRFHFSASGGKVMTRVRNRYSDHLEADEYYIRRYLDTSLNLVRKLQFTVSVSTHIETGIAICFLGEPSLWASKSSSVNSLYQGFHVNLNLDTRGYYAICVYKPLSPKSSRPFSWEIGIGLGVVNTDFRLNTSYDRYIYPEHTSLTDEHTIDKSFFSGVLFSELKLFLNGSTSIGLSADYIMAPSEEIPGYPYMNLPAQKIRLGNTSFGFNLGFHF